MGLSAAAVLISASGGFANNKPTEVPAKVIAHLALKEAPGNENALAEQKATSNICTFRRHQAGLYRD